MYPEPFLVTRVKQYLEGQCSSAEVQECARQSIESLEQHQSMMQGRLSPIPERELILLQPERASWEESCQDFLRWSRLALESDRSDDMVAFSEAFPIVNQRFQFDVFRLEEALWICLGPSSLSSLNRILAGIQQGLDTVAQCNAEANMLASGVEGLLTSYPEPLQDQVGQAVENILEWMENVPDEDQAFQEWVERGEALGREFTSHDLHFLVRGYVHSPTSFPETNLALNAIWLHEQRVTSLPLTLFCIDQSLQQLAQLPPLPEGDQLEMVEDLSDLLSQIADRIEKNLEVAALRQAAMEVALELQTAFQDANQEAPQELAKCPVCGQGLESGAQRCGACGSKLLGQSDPTSVENRLETVLGHAYQILEGADQETFTNELSRFQKDLKTAQQFQETSYTEIVAEYQMGLEQLAQFLQEPDRAQLDQAASRLRQAEQRLRHWREETLTT